MTYVLEYGLTVGELTVPDEFETSQVSAEKPRFAKQVILMRTDLKMGPGKVGAQAAHASLSAVLSYPKSFGEWNDTDPKLLNVQFTAESGQIVGGPVQAWLTGSFVKVCLGVGSEEELEELLAKARNAGLLSSRIVDEGRTVFNGTPTLTCGAIGPAWGDEINAITGHLRLL